MCSAFRACIVVGVICIVLGICFIFIGTFGVKYELPKQKFDFLVIDSENSASYKNWAGGYDEQVEYDMVFYFFNLTNPDDVRMNTAVPVYKQLGPYVYRRYRKAINVTFPDGGNQVSFRDFRQYQFNEEASSGSKHDYIVNLNPVFLSALGQAGSEQQMLGGAVGGYFQNYSKYFTTDFISLYTSYALPGYLHNVSMNQIAVINETLHDTTASTDYFLNAWCNGTTNSTTIGNWAGLLLSDHFGVPTNISKSSASMLLDPSIPYSLLNTATLTAWAWDRSLTNSSYTSLLLQTFDITPVQLEAIWFWRVKAFGPNFIYPGVIEKYNLTEISDLGWAQWNAGYDILGGSIEAPVSIHDLYPTEQIGYYTTVELFLYPSDPPVFEWQDLKQVMDPVTGLCNMVIFQEFALAMSNQTASTNFSQWGVNQDQAEQLYTYMFVAGVNQVVPALLAEYGDGGGLVLKQTVDDWVFNCNYFLINLLLPVPAPCSLLLNNTVFSTVTINSGKSDISKINEYIEWNGSPTVKGLWAQDIPVKGSTELGQFPPNENKATVLQTFNDEFVRTMTLTYNSSSAIRKIDTNQFTLNYNDIFAPNPLYFQTIPGFANLTSLKQAPIYYSLWDMLYVNESYRQSVVGLNNSTESDSSTSVDVEPITGNTLRVRKRLQANMFTPPGCTWCNNPISYLGNTGFQANTFYPFVKAGEYSEITEELASSVRVKIEALKYGTRYGMIVGLTVGIFLFVLGIILVFYGNVKRRQDYSRIRDFR